MWNNIDAEKLQSQRRAHEDKAPLRKWKCQESSEECEGFCDIYIINWNATKKSYMLRLYLNYGLSMFEVF